MFGFRLKAKSEHAATQVLSWYGEGRADVRFLDAIRPRLLANRLANAKALHVKKTRIHGIPENYRTFAP